MSFQSYLKRVKSEIVEVTVDELAGRPPRHLPRLIDVREADEWQEGHIPGATFIPRGRLEQRIENEVPDRDAEVVLYCAGGTRSALAAKSLRDLGYTNVKSLAGGFGAWKRRGHGFDRPFALTPAQRSRYARHLMLADVGEKGQDRLLRARLLLVGAGGLGAPAGLYLAAAGVGTLGIVDDDLVDASNLQRQVIHTTRRLNTPKVESAAEAIAELNPDVKVVQHRLRLHRDNVLDVIRDYDLVIDGTDNFQARYLLNDASLILRKPVVSASIFQFEGQVTVFQPFAGPCYRCLHPLPPPPGMTPSCGEAGVLGVVPGVVGLLQATEAVKLVLGIGRPLVGRLLQYDALGMKFREIQLPRDPRCVTCSEPGKPIELIDYDAFCNAG